jgi:hypothetical protein
VADWTVVIDAMLCERPAACLLCRRKARWLRVREVGDHAWLGALCGDCHSESAWAAVDRVFVQRVHALQHADRARKE